MLGERDNRAALHLFGVMFVLGLVLLLPGLGTPGFWSDHELPILDRTRAALGEARSGLLRSPFLPDALRTWSYSLVGGELGLRLPHAIAGAALPAIATALVRARGSSNAIALLAGAIALALPAAGLAARTVLGNPIGELVGVLAALAGARALGAVGSRELALHGALAIGLVAVSIASAGLVLGGCVPLFAMAVLADGERSRVRQLLPWLAMLVALAVAVGLSLRQQDGYIPLLGAAKDLALVDKPETRRFAVPLEDLGYQTFPWLPLALVGAAVSNSDHGPRALMGARPAALWLLGAATIACGWSLVYGTVHIPVTVPLGLCAAAAVEHLLDVERTSISRRIALLLAVGAMVVIAKDAERTPSRVAAPLAAFELEHDYPGERTRAGDRLGRSAALVAAALLALAVLARSGSGRRERVLGRVPARLRDGGALALVGLAAVWGAVLQTRVLLPQTGDLLSPKRLLSRHADWAAAGELAATLGVHRVKDGGIEIYGPDHLEVLGSRRDVATFLQADEPRAALIRTIDLPTIHQIHRETATPMFVLDDSHASLRLIANVVPEGAVDVNPIDDIVLDEPPVLANETLVRFESYVEVIGWEVSQPLVRGGEGTLQVVFKVLRPLPGGSKLHSRLNYGRISRINTEAHELAEGLYPCNLWRAGDFILHRFTFEVPVLETVPGEHEVVIGLRRSETENYDITVPEGKEGEFGVRVADAKHDFATIGTVEVW